MKVEEFFSKYANTPLDKRFKILDMNKHGNLTLHEIYKEIQMMEDHIRPYLIREQGLLKITEDYLNSQKGENK